MPGATPQSQPQLQFEQVLKNQPSPAGVVLLAVLWEMHETQRLADSRNVEPRAEVVGKNLGDQIGGHFDGGLHHTAHLVHLQPFCQPITGKHPAIGVAVVFGQPLDLRMRDFPTARVAFPGFPEKRTLSPSWNFWIIQG